MANIQSLFISQYTLEFPIPWKTITEILKKNEIGGLDLAFGYEALVRVYMVEKNQDFMEKHSADETGRNMTEDKQKKHYILLELKTMSI